MRYNYRVLTTITRHPIQKHHNRCRSALPGGAVDQHCLEDEEIVEAPMNKGVLLKVALVEQVEAVSME